MAKASPLRKAPRSSQQFLVEGHSRTVPIVASDDTDLAVQAQLENLEAQLDRLRSQVRQAQQLASLGTAAMTIAHEVNNILTPILGYAIPALAENDQALQRKSLEVTVRGVRMLVRMSERVLQLGAASPRTTQTVALRAAIEDAAESLCRDLSKDGITLAIAVDSSLTVEADELQLRQILFNLFLNARAAMKSSHNGKLMISAKRDGERVTIEVKDTGPGIPAEVIEHVFDPLQSSKPIDGSVPARCSGLGLALCRDLVEENGGTISVASPAGQGAAFTIQLPTGHPKKN